MLKACLRHTAWIYLLLGGWSTIGLAQQAGPHDAVVDAIRNRSDIGESDQRRISEWVERQVNTFIDIKTFRSRINEQYNHANNSEKFKTQLAAQTANVAARQFDAKTGNRDARFALARVLIDMDRPETFSGLLAGLKTNDARTRYLCAVGLAAQKRAITGDGDKLAKAIQALHGAGMVETDPVVLKRIYEALAYPGQTAAVFDSYMDLFDKRLAGRRGATAVVDGAELAAFEFFRRRGVVDSLSADQKSQLVKRLAVFLRWDAGRYGDPGLAFDEIDRIERALTGNEEILSVLVGSDKGGKIRRTLSAGGRTYINVVVQESFKWVGNPDTKEPGALNEAPWSVPVGAP